MRSLKSIRQFKVNRKIVHRETIHRETIGLLAVALLGFSLRFWQISRFNDLVFDEVYFAKFAQAYLAGTPQFDAHPPLSKYLIAAGIWLNTHGAILFPFFKSPTTPALGIPPFSYRWMNAFIGSLLPLLVFTMAQLLGRYQPRSQRLTFAVLAGCFASIDGLFITESRYALINIYTVFFGLLGHYLWLRVSLYSRAEQPKKTMASQLAAGMALGCAIATKWNGLGFVLSLVIYELCQTKRQPLIYLLIFVVLVPAIAYSLLWLPHLQLTAESLSTLHTKLFTFHQQLSTDGHPACSKWYTWPLLIKPITYWYEGSGAQVFTVSNLGNPILWWLSSAAVFLLAIEKTIRTASPTGTHNDLPSARTSTYLLASYAANWLPWIAVSRCTFIYLYMPAAVFSFMTLAWLMSQWLHSPAVKIKAMSIILLGAIAIAFLYWLPLNLGLPLTPQSLRIRWWLST